MMEILCKTIKHIHSKKLHLVPPGIFVVLFLISFSNREYSIYPGIGREKIEGFDDHTGGGNSTVDRFSIDDSSITLAYTLKEKIQYPYAGIKLVLKENSRYKDLSSYDYFSMDLEAKAKQDINIFIHTIVPGLTDESNVGSYGYLSKTFKFQQAREHFTVPLKTFAVPTWWYVANKIADDSLPKEKYKEVAEIIIESGYTFDANKPYAVTLYHLSFHKNMTKRALWALGACILWLMIYTLLYLLYKNRSNGVEKKVVISYEPLVVNNDSDECLNRIVAYIAKEYKNPELTVNQIASEVGLLPAKITQILRDKKMCSYKQYLNAIRLAEAKRLLLETDRNIVDIALKVGYNNVTHFNRIFKETEGVSPRQFRNQ